MSTRTTFRLFSVVCFLLAATSCMPQSGMLNTPWPQSWTVFGPVPKDKTLLEGAALATIPATLKIDGKEYRPVQVEAPDGRIDFVSVLYDGKEPKRNNARARTSAYAFAEFECKTDGTFVGGLGADWWLRCWIDGKEVVSTLATGNQMHDFQFTNYPFRVPLTKGKHTIAVLVRSGSAGWVLAGGGSAARQHKAIAAAEVALEERKKAAAEAPARFAKKVLANSRLKIAIYGSSVAYGSGAEKNFGWANRLGEVLKKRNWEFVNKSIGGDTTQKLLARIDTDLLPEKPDVVIIGLSLANEGIRRTNKDAIYRQYRDNMKKLIQVLRKNGIVPVITNCYPNSGYSPLEYAYIQKFNEELAQWPVASIDFLGTLDDTHGRWIAGTFRDGGHPNDAGHIEMMNAIPVTLFDCLFENVYPFPRRTDRWLAFAGGEKAAPLEYSPTRPVRSYTLGFECRIDEAGKEMVVAGLDKAAVKLDAAGHVAYVSSTGEKVATKAPLAAGKPVHVAVAYRHVLHTAWLYVDGKAVGSVKEENPPKIFRLGGTADASAGPSAYRNCMVYRSCLLPSLIRSVAGGSVLYSSLALYAPLDDTVVVKDLPLRNVAPTRELMVARSERLGEGDSK